MLFPLDLTCFLSLVTLLTGHPTELNSRSWHGGSEPYRITQRSYDPHQSSRRNDPGIEGRILSAFDPRNVTQSESEAVSPEGQVQVHSARYNDRWHQINERNPQLQFPSSSFPVPDLRQADQPSESDGPGRESFHSVIGEEFGGSISGTKASDGTEDYNSQGFNATYSSHVNCEEENQNREKSSEMESTQMVMYEKDEHEVNEKINFEENSRNFRRGNTRKGGTNTISTTEKIQRNQTQKGSKRPRPSSSKPQGGQIVFPDGYRRQKFTPRGSKCGKKTTFCEHIGEEYPSEYINQVLKREGAMFREFFGKDMISDPNITERIHAPEENSLCPFRQEVVFPRAAKNKDDKWLFVVNQDQYVQGVTVEVCLNPESRCILTEGFPLGYTPYCKQKYIERRLVAIGEDGKPHSDSFRLPSCCSCVVKHETSSRMGSLRTSRDMTPAVRTMRSTSP